MQRKSSFWLVVSLVCLGGSIYFWRLGDRWEAERKAAVATASAAKHAPKVAQRAGLSAGSKMAAGATNALAKNLYPDRLKNTDESLGKLVHNDRGILLQNALLDTGKPVDLKIPDRLKAPANNGSYLVQARGALNNDFRAALRAANATIVSYIPNNAYLVRVNESGANEIAANALTQSVLPYEPYYKLEPGLLHLAVAEPEASPVNGTLNVTLFPDAHDTVVEQLKGMGAIIASEDRSPFGPVLKVYSSPGTLSAVASLPGVQGVATWHARVSANDQTRPRLGISTDSVVPDTYLGLTGTNVIININDTGVDAGHPDLTNRISSLASESIFILTDPSGHGTHVAGTILGNGSESSTVTNAVGSLTNANFRGMAPDATAFVLSLDDSDSFLQEQGALAKARISNNSWNYGGSTAYDIEAASYDAAVRDALPAVTGPQSMLYVFSAGNNGGGFDSGTGATPDTILSPATAKNVITVGAIEQPRFITNLVVIGGVTNQLFFTDTDSDDQVAYFSSRGNVGINTEGTAGRFKPDVVSPGVFVISDRSGDWDTASYYNPTNFTSNFFPNEHAPTNVLTTIASVTLQANTVAVFFSLSTNINSPTNFPPMPIYVSTIGRPVLADLVGTNSIVLPTNAITFSDGLTLTFAVGNTYTQTVAFNATVTVVSTNDTGYYISLSNLNNGLAPYYRYESGTSMAAAGVSGMMACVEEFFEKLKLTNSPALMKALLIGGSRSVGALYDYGISAINGNSQGWGLPNIQNIIPAAMNGLTSDTVNTPGVITNLPLVFFDQSPTNVLATGESKTRTISLSPDGENQDLRITLAWTDPPGNPSAGTKLVNDLDLVVTNLDDGEVFYGNDIPDGSVYTESFFGGDGNPPNIDSVNNVENVFLQQPLGSQYSITVYGRRVNVNAVTGNTNDIVQDYALVMSSDVASGGITNPFTALVDLSPGGVVDVGVSNVYVVSNALPLFNQRVGANAQYTGSTNGNGEQWNFYVYTNTPSLTNTTFTNVAFLTFLPPNLGVPVTGASVETAPPDTNATRFNGADVDLYVSTQSGLTNLDPVVIANAFVSTSRSGTEKVLLTNQPAGQVYYIGVRSQDQQAAQYDFFAVAINQPFDQTDQNGNTLVTILTPFPVVIPPGGPNNPNHALILGVSTSTTEVRKAVVTNTVAHQEFGDLIGTLTHERLTAPKVAVLNNHSFFNNPADAFETLVYDDSGENEFPFARQSDGPGTLRNFTSDKAADGIWMFTEVNDSSLVDQGSISNFIITLEPQVPPGHGFFATIPAQSWFYGIVDVPAQATNLAISLSQNSQNLDLYVRDGDYPTFNIYDKFQVMPAGSATNTLNLSKFDSPPLNAGTYYYGIYNPSLVAVTVYVVVDVQLSIAPLATDNFLSVGDEPLLDDAVTYSTNSVGMDNPVVSVDVGVRIDHPRESDLVLTLISPLGTRVLLAENRGGEDTNGYGSGVNITNVLPQATSGGAASETNTIPLTQNLGTLQISYDFETVPDDMRIYYGTQRIFDTGLINGSGTFAVDFGPGSATSLSIVMNEPGSNPTTNNDIWNYTASVITRELVYATFTEDTNKTTLPIKFAIPPFGTNHPVIPAANVLTSSFEVPAGDYAVPSLVDGWSVQNTNPVKVVSVSALADTGTNVLALHNGSISRVMPTVAGKSYTLTFASHGRPALSPVSWWKGEDTTGVAADSALGSPNPGLYENNASSISGLVSNAFQFNGINQFIGVADSASLRFTNAMTAEVWIYPTNNDTSQVHDILSKYDALGYNPGQRAYGMGLRAGGTAYMIINTNQNISESVATLTSIPQNQWSYLAATYDTNGLTMYLNGVLQQTQPFIGNIFPGSDALGIGGNIGGAPPNTVTVPFGGLIDEATVYSNALSILQIQDIYAAGSAGKDYPVGTVPQVSAKIIIGTQTNILNNAADAWQTNSYTFFAVANNMPLTIIPNQDGMLLDSFNLVQNASLSQTNYYLPEEPMDKLIGQSAKGNWLLEVLDNRAGATNPPPMLVSWELNFVLADTVSAAPQLLHAIPQTNVVAPNSIAYYQVNVPLWAKFATNFLVASGPVNLLFDQNILPGNGGPDFTLMPMPILTNGSVTLTTNLAGVPPLLIPGQRYYLAVQNTGATPVNFIIEVDFDITPLTNAVPFTNAIASGNTPTYYQFDVDTNAIAASFEVLNPSGQVEMVIKKGPPLPDEQNFDYELETSASGSIIVLTNSLPVPVGPGRWYIGIFNESLSSTPVTYAVRATEAFAPTIIPLTNAIPFKFNSPPGPALTNFFVFSITNNISPTNGPAAVLFELYSLSGNVDLDVDTNQLPYMPPFFASSANLSTNREQVVVRTNATGTNLIANWYLGVPNNDSTNVTYTIRAVVSTNNLLISGVPITVAATLPPPGSPNGPTLTFPAVIGELYQLQYTSNFTTWINIGSPQPAFGETVSLVDPSPLMGTRFYRVLQLPNPND